jgi:Putative DNA-binding domain
VKHSRLTNLSKSNSNTRSPETLTVDSRPQLKKLQRLMASAIFRPLTARDGMQRRWRDGRSMHKMAARFIKPNDRLTSFDRLEIYNRVYWFRVLDCLYDDYPGLRAIVGQSRFMKLITAYLAKYPSASFTLRNLGQRLEQFLREEPGWIAPHHELALDMTRFEWAQVVAFDDAAKPPITTDDILDTPPAKLRLSLQPYLSLLELNYAVDKFFLAVQKRDADVLRDEASNTFEAMPSAKPRKRPVRLPKREHLHVAVHRYDNTLFYKRLDPEAFTILQGLRRGRTVEKACVAAISNSTRTCVDWPSQIKEWFSDWSSLGWFCRFKK